MLDIDSNGALLFKESSHLQPEKLVSFKENDRTEHFKNFVPFTVEAKFEQGILPSTDSTGECFHYHRLTSEKEKSIIMFIHGGPHRAGFNTLWSILYGPYDMHTVWSIHQVNLLNQQLKTIHSNMTNVFSAKIFGYLVLGYDFIIPNYRGSIGYGAGYVRQLPYYISEKDVSDCFKAMAYASYTKSYNLKYVMGGSHGGFLTGNVSAIVRL